MEFLNEKIAERRNSNDPFRSGCKKIYFALFRSFCFMFIWLFLMVAMGNEKILAEENQQGKSIQAKQDETDKNEYYAVFDKLKCGDSRVTSVLVRNKGEEFSKGFISMEIFDQTIYIQPPGSLPILVRGSSDWDILDKLGKQDMSILENRRPGAPWAAYWNCIKGNSSKEYVVVHYTSGGNCPTCVWEEIYGLDGKVLASSYTPRFKLSFMTDEDCRRRLLLNEEGRKAMDEFDNTIEKLGIQYDFESLKQTKYEN